MKVLIINGSPRANGNTATALGQMTNIFEKHSVEYEIVQIGNMQIRGCQSCGYCYKNGKCAFDHRSTAPGQHGAARKKVGEYGKQLREKQKARRYYGVLESQFRDYYEMATKMEGKTGEAAVLSQDPDIVCLQEFKLSSSQKVREYLSRKMRGYSVEYYMFPSGSGSFGNETLSRLPYPPQ